MTRPGPTHFEMIGGAESLRRLVDRFYDLMDALPEAADVRALHPTSLDSSREKLYLFLTGWLGGPPVYVERFGPPMLRARHLPFSVGDAERDAWMLCMRRALEEHPIPPELRDFLRDRFQALADHMRNRED
jgi:hemoglobin